jgi:signal transduction histidine kinase
VLINKKEIERLSADIRRIIDGQDIDLRDNREGVWGILKNDIHTLASLKNEQVDALQRDRSMMKDSLTNITHQLKTPLTSMMIMADLLENTLASENSDPDKQAEFISNIKTGLTRMEWLVSALLKMAKLDAGAVEFLSERIQSSELARFALEPLQILLDVKNQNVEISCGEELYCDRRWTVEALSNVLKNASEYSPDGGLISISSGSNPICSWISVTDSGEGISNTDIARIFKQFEGSRSDKGYGIGLPLALAIMRGQNGDIQVDGGGIGSGATFTLKFFK